MKKLKVAIIVLILVIISLVVFKTIKKKDVSGELIEISSQEELNKIYEERDNDTNILTKILTLPFSADISDMLYNSVSIIEDSVDYSGLSEAAPSVRSSAIDPASINGTSKANTSKIYTLGTSGTSKKDYSTTNIQVENVDEADITKTDGDYIYSLSEDKVIITDVKNPEKPKIVSRISNSDSIPEEILLYDNKLVVISEKSNTNYYSSNVVTKVIVFDITDKERPVRLKRYELEQKYYTSRCINGKLYVIASGYLKKENDNVITYYKEDGKKVDPGYKGIKRIKDLDTRDQTIISMLDLNNLNNNVKVNSYLMNIENAYISEHNIYLLDEENNYDDSDEYRISSIFGLKGVFGIMDNYEEDNYFGYNTQIYKFKILEDGNIQFDKKGEVQGETINQFSIDEYEDNLRLALYTSEGSRVVILDNNLNILGETEKVAAGEEMYSSRFMGNKAYLVTYQNTDPLFVIDLSNPKAPEVLGELKIPGYSTYLHPYDETHLIGIGMQTEEKIRRNYLGEVISTSAVITGMKMALFDVSDVNNPIQMSEVTIGDSRTTSAILTNHKALLFSKEKELLAIPVNHYEEDFEIDDSENISTTINYYTNYDQEYVSEGYLVYKINLEDGLKLKGSIVHNKEKEDDYSYYYKYTRLLRGLYIDDNLYTISEDYIKVNELETLKEISSIKINGNKEENNGR